MLSALFAAGAIVETVTRCLYEVGGGKGREG